MKARIDPPDDEDVNRAVALLTLPNMTQAIGRLHEGEQRFDVLVPGGMLRVRVELEAQ